MLTVQLAAELKGTSIKVNSDDPGFTATDLNGHRGYQTVPRAQRPPSGSRCSWTTDPPVVSSAPASKSLGKPARSVR